MGLMLDTEVQLTGEIHPRIFQLQLDPRPNCIRSLNYHTPTELCTVRYHDLDHAVQNCLNLMKRKGVNRLYYTKSDARSAFRLVPLLPAQYCWLVMKAQDPVSGKFYYFVDKCLPFGASRSCAIFQAFLDALKHIMNVRTQAKDNLTNYLDDFLFIAWAKLLCDRLVHTFLHLCKEVGCPIAEEKTEWGSSQMIFLGILLDGERHIIAIPDEKKNKSNKYAKGINNVA